MNENNFKKALFDALSPEYEKMLSEQESEHEFSPKFNKDMEKLIKRRKKPYYKLINTFGKRVACVVCAVLVVSSATVLSVSALRNRVSDVFINVYNKFSTVQSNNTDNAPETIETIYEIGYDLSNFSVDYENYTDYQRHIIYRKDDVLIEFKQITKSTHDDDVNTENSDISTIYINGCDAIYFRDNHNFDFIIWDNEDYDFTINSNIGKDVLIQIVESVHKAE